MTVTGNNVILFIDVAGTWTPYACARSATINITTETIETSVSGSGLWATFLPTKNSFSISMDGVVAINEAGSLVLSDLHALQFAQTILLLRFERTDQAGSVYANECSGYITGSSDTGNFDDMDTFSIEIQGTGALTQGVGLAGIFDNSFSNTFN